MLTQINSRTRLDMGFAKKKTNSDKIGQSAVQLIISFAFFVAFKNISLRQQRQTVIMGSNWAHGSQVQLTTIYRLSAPSKIQTERKPASVGFVLSIF